MKKAEAIADARIKIDNFHWYVPHYIASTSQQGILSEQFVSETTTELGFVERSVSMKELNNQNLRKLELVSHESMNVPIWMIVGFQHRTRQDLQNLINGVFYRLPFTSAQCNIGTEKYPDAGNYVDDYSQGY